MRKLLKSFFCLFFVRLCLWRKLLSACILSTYFKIFLRSLCYSRNLLVWKRKNHPARWFFRRFSKPASFWTVVTGFRRAQQPNLSFQCSRTDAHTSRATSCLADKSSANQVTNGCCQWRFVVSFRVGLKSIVTGTGAAVGLNGGFVHTVQLGANCLPGTECQAWNEINAAITAEWHR